MRIFSLAVMVVLPLTAQLSLQQATHLAELPLKCLNQEYPNKTGHTIESGIDAKLTPSQLHPSFYGCFDWHSSVHGHWMLVRLLRTMPQLPKAKEIRAKLNQSFSSQNLSAEAAYFDRFKLANIFERTYGWAWLLKLDQELLEWKDPDAARWRANLGPLAAKVVNYWKVFLPKQTYPNRTGVHPNTAFGLVFALDWSQATKDQAFESLIRQRAKDYFAKNANAPAYQEPDGSDFLSPSLEVCDLMRRILSPAEFLPWFNAFLTTQGLENVLKKPVVSDRNDFQIVHLDGLFLSRAWCLKGIANVLPPRDPRKARMLSSAADFIQTALPNISGVSYGGEHWLASFAIYALSQ